MDWDELSSLMIRLHESGDKDGYRVVERMFKSCQDKQKEIERLLRELGSANEDIDEADAVIGWMGRQTDIRGVKDIYEYWDDGWLFDLIHSHEHDPALREYLVVPETVADKLR